MFELKQKIATSSLALVAALLMPGSIAFAQDGTPTAEDEEAKSGLARVFDPVIVTGTKKAEGENVQEASVAIRAFSADALEVLQVRDLSSLSFSIPNVTLEDIGTTKGVANFSVRGLTVNSSIPSLEPAVGTIVDGVYLGVNGGVVFDTFDLASVEVLRGPQGVLFGRNVTGGAVLVNTSDPQNEFGASARVAVESGLRGTGENYTAQGVVTGPIIGDVLSAKVALYYNDDGGFFENSLADVAGPTAVLNGQTETFGRSDTFIGRAALKFTPTDRAELTIKFEHGESDGDGPAVQNADLPDGPPGQVVTFDPTTFDFSINDGTFQDSEWNQVIVKGSLDVDFGDGGTITNIFGWREYTQTALTDIDATPVAFFDANFGTDQQQISNELRYNGRFFGRADVTAGVYYFTQDLTYLENRDLLGFLTPDGSPFLTQNGGGVQDSDTLGIFAAIDYELTDRWSVNAGIRFSDESKDVQLASLVANVNAPCSTFEGTCPFDITDSFNSSNFSPKVGVAYEHSDNLRGYAHWSRAFRAGGFNLRNTSADLVNNGPQFDDERVDSFEIGLKSEPTPNSTLNFAAFFNVADNLQRDVTQADGTSGFVQTVQNAADAIIYGVELDGYLEVLPGVVLEGAIGFVDNDFRNILFDLNNDGVIDGIDGSLQLPRLANFSGSFSIFAERETDFGRISGRLGYSHRDRAFGSDDNVGILPSQDRIDANFAITLPGDKLTLSLYGKNLTNEVTLGGVAALPPVLGAPLGGSLSTLKRGRIFGLELRFNAF